MIIEPYNHRKTWVGSDVKAPNPIHGQGCHPRIRMFRALMQEWCKSDARINCYILDMDLFSVESPKN